MRSLRVSVKRRLRTCRLHKVRWYQPKGDKTLDPQKISVVARLNHNSALRTLLTYCFPFKETFTKKDGSGSVVARGKCCPNGRPREIPVCAESSVARVRTRMIACILVGGIGALAFLITPYLYTGTLHAGDRPIEAPVAQALDVGLRWPRTFVPDAETPSLQRVRQPAESCHARANRAVVQGCA